MLDLILKETSFLEEIKLIQQKDDDVNTFVIQWPMRQRHYWLLKFTWNMEKPRTISRVNTKNISVAKTPP